MGRWLTGPATRPEGDMLTTEQVDFYREQGYLAVPGVIAPERIAEAQRVTDELVERSRSVGASDDTFDVEPGHTADRPQLRRIKDPFTKHPVYEALARDEKVLDILADLIGPDIRYQGSKLNMKAASDGSAVEWHQDVPFYPYTNDDLCAVGIAIDDADTENGCLLVVPGSHRGPILSHNRDGVFVGAVSPEVPEIAEAEIVPVVLQAGDISIHHVRMLHASAPNRSNRSRRLLLNQYTAADAFPIVQDLVTAGSPSAQIVRGEAPSHIRVAGYGDIPVAGRFPENAGSIFDVQEVFVERAATAFADDGKAARR